MNTSGFTQVERRANLSRSEFRHYYLYARRPVVITDAIDDWKDNAMWSLGSIGSLCGDEEVLIYHYDPIKEFSPDDTRTIRLGEFISRIQNEDWSIFPYYLRDNWQLFRLYPDLMRTHRVPEYFFDWFRLLPPFMRMPYPRIFIGPKGAVTPLHVDVWETHAWLSQLVGRKRWLLYPPEQSDLHYNCEVRVEVPDFDRFPRFSETRPLECVIGPGDTIFVPSGWAHWVESLDVAISVTYNYMGPGCFANCLAQTVRTQVVDRLARKVSGLATALRPGV